MSPIDESAVTDKPSAEAVSVQRAAALLDVHEDTIHRWRRLGIIDAVRLGPRLWRIPKTEIARLRGQKSKPHNAA